MTVEIASAGLMDRVGGESRKRQESRDGWEPLLGRFAVQGDVDVSGPVEDGKKLSNKPSNLDDADNQAPTRDNDDHRSDTGEDWLGRRTPGSHA
jgi:hypothetical protein